MKYSKNYLDLLGNNDSLEQAILRINCVPTSVLQFHSLTSVQSSSKQSQLTSWPVPSEDLHCCTSQETGSEPWVKRYRGTPLLLERRRPWETWTWTAAKSLALWLVEKGSQPRIAEWRHSNLQRTLDWLWVSLVGWLWSTWRSDHGGYYSGGESTPGVRTLIG